MSVNSIITGKLVEAYVVSNGTATLIGRGKPRGKRHVSFPIKYMISHDVPVNVFPKLRKHVHVIYRDF